MYPCRRSSRSSPAVCGVVLHAHAQAGAVADPWVLAGRTHNARPALLVRARYATRSLVHSIAPEPGANTRPLVSSRKQSGRAHLAFPPLARLVVTTALRPSCSISRHITRLPAHLHRLTPGVRIRRTALRPTHNGHADVFGAGVSPPPEGVRAGCKMHIQGHQGTQAWKGGYVARQRALPVAPQLATPVTQPRREHPAQAPPPGAGCRGPAR